MSRDIEKAVWQIVAFDKEFLVRAKSELGLDVIRTSVDRTYFEQVAIVLQGRIGLHSVNIARKVAGMAPISEAQNVTVSWTLDSKHVINPYDTSPDNDKARAVDYGILDKDGKYQGSEKADTNGDNKSDYQQLGELGMKIVAELDLPIIWGGDFKQRLKGKDLPHWELI